MILRYFGIFCICAALCSACSSKKDDPSSGNTELAQFGVWLKMPPNFQPVPINLFADIESAGLTVLSLEPFTVIPRYGYKERSGKGIIIISELQFGEGVMPEKYPMNNVYTYQKNLAGRFGVDAISSEEIDGGGVTTVLLALMFTEGDDDISLFKGLCYKYPQRFFMIDLYVMNSRVTREDAAGFQNMFYSMGIQ